MLIYSRKTMTAIKAPGTVDFMPPEMLTKCPDQLYDVFVFSFAEIVIQTLTQKWPTSFEQTQDHAEERYFN